MKASRTITRISAFALAFPLLLTVPAGIAQAHDNGSHDNGTSCSTRGNHHDNDLCGLTAAQATAVEAARAQYKATAKSIMADLKATLAPTKERFKNAISAEYAAKNAAGEAYANALKANADAATLADLKAKYEAARAAYITAAKAAYGTYKAAVAEASATAKVELAKAALVYTKAINAAFAPAAAPESLLEAPGARIDYDAWGPKWFGYHHSWDRHGGHGNGHGSGHHRH